MTRAECSSPFFLQEREMCADHGIDGSDELDTVPDDMQGTERFDVPDTIANIVASAPPVVGLPLPDQYVQLWDSDVQEHIDHCNNVLAANRQTNALRHQPAPPNVKLQIIYNNTGRATGARVDWGATPPPANAAGAAADTIAAGSPLPFVRTDVTERPTLTTTVQLSNLCPEQEFAFRLIMHTLQQHVSGQPFGGVPQFTMSLHGHAGW
jgi:hypothetical protein